MSKKRVYEVAKELGVENKVVIDALKKHNIDVKSHMSTVEDSQLSMIKQYLGNSGKPAQSGATKETQGAPQKKVHEYHLNDQGEQKRGPKQDRNHRNDRNNGQRDNRNDRQGDSRFNQRNGQNRDGRRPEGRNDQRPDNRNGGNRPNNGGRFDRNNDRNNDRRND